MVWYGFCLVSMVWFSGPLSSVDRVESLLQTQQPGEGEVVLGLV
jgi:hypothetical protein